MPNYLFSIKSVSFKLSNPAESQKSNGKGRSTKYCISSCLPSSFPTWCKASFSKPKLYMIDLHTYWLSLPIGISGCDFNWKCQSVPQHSIAPSVFSNWPILNKAESQNLICEWSAF